MKTDLIMRILLVKMKYRNYQYYLITKQGHVCYPKRD